tara:strand:+ start:407 stop:664 length:258 start_codon:yes stop_codon:yes gene_type:complete
MLYDSILEIPNAVASDVKIVKDPYMDEAASESSQRKTGILEFVAKPRVTWCFNPRLIQRDPGKINENEPDTDTEMLRVAGDDTMG